MSNPVDLKLKKSARATLACVTATTSKTVTVDVNGFLRFIVLELPNFTTAATVIVTVVNGDSLTLYTSGSLAENAQHNIVIADGYVPVMKGDSIVMTLNAQAGGSHSMYLTYYVR